MVSDTNILAADPLSPAICEGGLHGLDLFIQQIPQMLDHNEIWEMWRPSQHFQLFAMFLEPILKNSFSVGVLKQATDTGYHCNEGMNLVGNNVRVGGTSQSNIHLDGRTQDDTWTGRQAGRGSMILRAPRVSYCPSQLAFLTR